MPGAELERGPQFLQPVQAPGFTILALPPLPIVAVLRPQGARPRMIEGIGPLVDMRDDAALGEAAEGRGQRHGETVA